MRFKIDENLPVELRTDLLAAGHEAETVPDEGLTGSPDSAILRYDPSGHLLVVSERGVRSR